jgi:2'-5' RNA ligase
LSGNKSAEQGWTTDAPIMSEQLSLAGFDPPAPPADRLFFALLPDAESARRIAVLTQQLRSEHALKGKPLPVERLHVTLYFLGDFAGLPLGIVTGASKAASSLAVPAFEVAFDRVMSFSGNRRGRPLVLRGGGELNALIDFQHILALAMSKEGLKPADHSGFTPHVTLLYDERGVAEHTVEPIRWTANEFVLVRGAIGQGRYEMLARWSLA